MALLTHCIKTESVTLCQSVNWSIKIITSSQMKKALVYFNLFYFFLLWTYFPPIFTIHLSFHCYFNTTNSNSSLELLLSNQ